MIKGDFGVNQALVDEQYDRYLADPEAVDERWRRFFESAEVEPGTGNGSVGASTASARVELGTARAVTTGAAASPAHTPSELAWNVSRLVSAYRSRGHYHAKTDPLGLSNTSASEFAPAHFGIADSDLDRPVQTDIPGVGMATPREIIQMMEQTYCGSIGVELMHIEREDERTWLLRRLESTRNRTDFSREQRVRMLEQLTDAEQLEQFLHSHYIGAKRFSLEGLDALIPMLWDTLNKAGDSGVRDCVVGMAHRGRLNVLVNILDKTFEELFSAFNDEDSETMIGRGDVKYHLGYHTNWHAPSGDEIYVSLCFNPSHLEFVDPVVAGRCRAKLERRGDKTGRSVLPVMIHGDGAFMGQGIVTETLNLAELEGYRVGGTVHVVLNNQVAFTTSPGDSRSSRYATDVVRFLRVPVFHVNAEDIEAVIHVTRLAVEYRQRFGRDVCIDLIGYRRHGHNEGDEPRFTQPVMYSVIDQCKSPREVFAEHLIEAGDLTDDDVEEMKRTRFGQMVEALERSKNKDHVFPTLTESLWQGYIGGADDRALDVDTGYDSEALAELLGELTDFPDWIDANKKLERVYGRRRKALEGEDLDWGTGEMLAYATLIAQGYRVRMSGQDARRGTFSHRHAYIADRDTGRRWSPYEKVARNGGWLEIWDSPLSEAAVLGFEYGYSLEAPDALVIWEAQFGDFANGAQVIIDQFVSSGEDKWGRLTGLAMLLPHGFEGQGPEHSYARLGRFLQLCAEDNMQVCDVTTPAQFFHLIRRQVLRPLRKPLVLMSPKSLLRHKRCVSKLEDLADGAFERIIPDQGGGKPANARRVLLCSGRIYYDLEQEREEREAGDVAIIRLEQLYPLDGELLSDVLSPYPAGTELVWVQDEPWNMGAWYFIKVRLQALFGDNLPIQCVARAESASPATGSAASHRLEHKLLMDAAFGQSKD